jgi:hypothetical protein
VQGVLTTIVLLSFPSPVRSSMPVVAVALAALALGVVLLVRAMPEGGRSRWARTWRAARSDVRDGLLARRAWPGIVLPSAIVVAGHAATFLIAARTAGATASFARLLPLALLVLLGATVPSIAGWGPREGVAAWVFGAAGLGAAQGVATAVVYGVMVVVASLPGAVVLVMAWLHRRAGRRDPADLAQWRVPAAARSERAGRG